MRTYFASAWRHYFASAFLFALSAPVLAGEPSLPAGVVAPGFFGKAGVKVTGFAKAAGGLNVWTVERNGTKTVMYTTADNKVLLSGVLWDADTGANLSDAYITPDIAQQVPSAAPVASNGPKGTPGKVSESIAGIAKLTGIKEGKGPVDKTIYVMFDPRCPYCKALYSATREWVRKGGSIKWIPTTVLGHDQNATNMVADILQDANPISGLARVETGQFRKPASVAPATLKAISQNEEYFYAAFQRNPSIGVAGVPVAFFQTKDGSPQMVMNLDDPLLLNQIFQDVSQ